jgi:hypothetical protein
MAPAPRVPLHPHTPRSYLVLNQARVQHGLPSLVDTPELGTVALAWSARREPGGPRPRPDGASSRAQRPVHHAGTATTRPRDADRRKDCATESADAHGRYPVSEATFSSDVRGRKSTGPEPRHRHRCRPQVGTPRRALVRPPTDPERPRPDLGQPFNGKPVARTGRRIARGARPATSSHSTCERKSFRSFSTSVERCHTARTSAPGPVRTLCSLAAARRPKRQAMTTQDSSLGSGVTSAARFAVPLQPGWITAVPCIYCRAMVPADSFAYWFTTKRLLSADCPSCQRRVTLAAATWRRWRAAAVQASTRVSD